MGYERYARMTWDANAKPKPVPWLATGLILQGGITAVLGPEKSGKSRFLGWLLAGMLGSPQGGTVLRYDSGAIVSAHSGFRKVLYINAEEQATDVMARVNAYAERQGFTPRDDWPIVCVNGAGMQLQRQIERTEFNKEFLANREFDVVVIDPLRRVHAGNENDNSQMAGMHNDLRRWSQQYNQTWLVVHHSPKFREDDDLERIATWSRGNTDLVTLLDGALMLRGTGGTKDQQRRMLKRMGRFAPEIDLTLKDYGEPRGFVVE